MKQKKTLVSHDLFPARIGTLWIMFWLITHTYMLAYIYIYVLKKSSKEYSFVLVAEELFAHDCS